jgi:lambda repressor-like predicted transcriptional regulator
MCLHGKRAPSQKLVNTVNNLNVNSGRGRRGDVRHEVMQTTARGRETHAEFAKLLLSSGRSLRQVARETGVSPAFLSMCLHGKRAPSQKLVNTVNNLNVSSGQANYHFLRSKEASGGRYKT